MNREECLERLRKAYVKPEYLKSKEENEIKQKLLKGELPVIIGTKLSVTHMGAINVELTKPNGEIELLPYPKRIVLWDISVAEVGYAGELTFQSTPPRVLICGFLDSVLYVVEAEYA